MRSSKEKIPERTVKREKDALDNSSNGSNIATSNSTLQSNTDISSNNDCHETKAHSIKQTAKKQCLNTASYKEIKDFLIIYFKKCLMLSH